MFVTSHRPAHTSRAHLFSFDRILHFAFEVISVFFPTQAFNLSFKDSIKLCSRLQPEAGFRHVLRCEHGVWWCFGSRDSYDRVSSGLRSNAPSFGCWLGTKPPTVCSFVLRRRLLAQEFLSLYAGFGVSLGEIIPYRCFQLVPSTPSFASTRGSTTLACLLRLHLYGGTNCHHFNAGIHIRVRKYSRFYTL